MLVSWIAGFIATCGLVEDVSARSHSQPNGLVRRQSTNSSNVALLVNTKGKRNATSPLLYGWMLEDINVSRRFSIRLCHLTALLAFN
jgi:hypothetical protein